MSYSADADLSIFEVIRHTISTEHVYDDLIFVDEGSARGCKVLSNVLSGGIKVRTVQKKGRKTVLKCKKIRMKSNFVVTDHGF